MAFFSYFQLRTPVEKVLPCGHPAVNECLRHHSLQRPPPTHPHPIAHPSTCCLCCSGRCWPLLSVWHHLFLFFVCAQWCLSMKYFSQAVFQIVFLYNLQKKPMIFVPWFFAWWSELFIYAYNINIHHCCSECVLKQKWKDASHSVGKI